jgi:hypothetical protein
MTGSAKQSISPRVAAWIPSSLSLLAMTRMERCASKQPDGQITSTSRKVDPSSLYAKNISLNPSGKSALPTRPSHPMRGALRNVTNARWDAVDAALAKTNAR